MSQPYQDILKQRLTALSPAQRDLLAKRLAVGDSKPKSSKQAFTALKRSPPLRIEMDTGVKFYPASAAQQRMWFLHKFASEAPVYNCPWAFHLHGRLDIPRLEAALERVIQRHDSLRTTFVLEDKVFLQRISPSSDFKLQHLHLDHLPSADRESAARIHVDKAASLPFDLEKPQFRAVLVRLDTGGHLLLLVIHHIISDGWSRSNLSRELAAIYNAPAAGDSSPLADLPAQYADYASWQKAWLESGTFKEQRDYWLSKLSGEIKSPALPTDRERPPFESFRGNSISAQLDPALLAQLKTRAQSEGATLPMILLAAFNTLLHRWTGDLDLVIGMPIANRQRTEVEGLIGFFVNTLAIRTSLAGNPSFRELLHRVKVTAVDAYAHQDMPLEQLVELLKLPRDPGSTPIFQTIFAFQDFPQVELQLAGLESTMWPVTTNTAKFDLSFTIERPGGVWMTKIEYATDLFDRERMKRLLEEWHSLLGEIIAELSPPTPECTLSTVAGLIPAAEIESSYPLSPMQQGMLFHHTSSPGSGVDVEQLVCTLREAVDASKHEEAWNRVVKRHPALRTAFRWDDLGTPLQDVRSGVELPFERIDWRELPILEQEKRLAEFLIADRARGFIIHEAPLMRLTLFHRGEQNFLLVWTFHHLLIDGRSMAIILKEVFADHHASATVSPRPYGDFIRWLGHRDTTNDCPFWSHHLAGLKAPTPLVIGRRMPPEQPPSGRGLHQTFLPAASTARLMALASGNNFTLNTLAQGAWALLLQRYSGENDIVFGATRACRHSTVDDSATMVGLFINTLPVRTHLLPDQALVPWLKELRDQWVSLRAFEHTPLANIQTWSEVGGDKPLFETLLVFEHQRLSTSLHQQGGAWTDREFQLHQNPGIPIIMEVHGGAELSMQLNFDASRFDDPSMLRMLGHFKTLLEAMADNPEALLGDLPVITDAERRQILGEWNDTRRDYPHELRIELLFAAQAAARPDAVALCNECEHLSYRELNERADHLACQLVHLGVAPGDVVGLNLERSIHMIIGMLGALKAGAIYWAMETDQPKERLLMMLDDAMPRLLLSEADSADQDLPCKVVTMADLLAMPARPPISIHPELSSNAPAYINYTSGSTGKPKAVLVPHCSVVRLVINTDYVQVDSSDLVAHAANPAFDASTFEIWSALLNGAQCVILHKEAMLIPERLAEKIRDHGITTLFLTTSVFNQVAEQLPSAFAPLRHLLFGGETSNAPCVRRVLEGGAPKRLVHVYGPTETTTFATWLLVTQVAPDLVTLPIGHPISNTTIYVLTDDRQLAPVGIPGEIYIGGPGVACGYLNHPELTVRYFLPDPFSANRSARMYRTGDRGQWTEDGRVLFLGRLDSQIKIRGFRIELEEIESALLALPGISGAVVISQKDDGDGNGLVAYLTYGTGGTISQSELQKHLSQRLPDYMIPAGFVLLDHFPLTPNGKTDRGALSGMSGQTLTVESGKTAPRNELESKLVEIWKAVLRRERVGIHDDFFMLGGHSLLAVKVLARTRAEIGLEIPLRSFFDEPTIAGFASAAGILAGKASPLGRLRLPLNPGGIAPLSFAQQRLWFLDRLENQSKAYHMTGAFRLTGTLDTVALGRAVCEVVNRHESLRTRFVEIETEPMQIVTDETAGVFTFTDLSGLAEGEREKRISKLRQANDAAFDLSKDPLLRITLIKCDEAEHLLLRNMHHIISDAWSVNLLHHEMRELYGAFREEKSNPLEPIATQYASYAAWQRQKIRGDELERLLGYWSDKLSGASPLLALPTDFPRAANSVNHGGMYDLELPHHLTCSLRILCQREGVTLFVTFLTALNVLLSRLSGQDDIIIGTPISGRDHLAFEHLIGFFINTVAIRSDLSGNPSFIALLEQVRLTTLEAFEHQDLPFEKLIEVLHLTRNENHSPVFQVFLNMIHEEDQSLSLPGLVTESLAINKPDSKFDITLYITESGGSIRIRAVYKEDLFHRETIGRMLKQFELLLEQIVIDPAAGIQNHSLVHPEDSAILPDPTLAFPPVSEPAIHHGFACQVARVPGRTAVIDGTASWTYAELNATSNRLANHLRGQGVRRGDVVAIYASASAALVWSLLAVMKAGCVFVVLDAAYPALRLRRTMKQAKPQALLHLQCAGHLPVGLGRYVSKHALRCVLEIPTLKPKSPFPASSSAEDPGVSVGGADKAYLVYTSGSTGKPLGIIGTHAPVSHFLRWHIANFGLNENDRFSLLSGPAHDPLLRDIFTPLWLGATLHIPSPDVRRTPHDLTIWITDRQITACHLTPALAEWLVVKKPGEPHPLNSLRWMFLGGDRLTRKTAEHLMRLAPKCQIVNFYGTSETPQAMGFQVVNSEHLASLTDGIPLGKGIDGAQLLLLNPAGVLAACGEYAEIAIRSPYLSTGYLASNQQARNRFQISSFTNNPADRIYRTGDMGRYLRDGSVSFVGRRDEQVKIRGYRVELGEVEQMIRELPEVDDCMVMIHESDVEENQLVAYLVCSGPNPAPTTVTLQKALRRKLPGAMIPSRFFSIPPLKLTPNGKPDRRALERTTAVELISATSRIAPQNELERTIIEIWQTLLNRDSLGIHDNFFDIGGHSLLVLKVFSLLRERTNVDLPVRTIFEAPTAATLAKRLDLEIQTQKRGGPTISSYLVSLRKGDPITPPLIIFGGGWSGEEELLVFANLIHSMPLNQPVIGVTMRLLEPAQPLIVSIKERAGQVLREITRQTGDKPFHILGECIACPMSFEVARQALTAGRPLASLIMLDPVPRSLPPPKGFFQNPWIDRLLRRPDHNDQVSQTKTEATDAFPPSITRYHQLLRDYRPRKIKLAIDLVTSEDKTHESNSSLGWMPFASSIRLHPVPGSHHSYIREHALGTAAKINSILKR